MQSYASVVEVSLPFLPKQINFDDATIQSQLKDRVMIEFSLYNAEDNNNFCSTEADGMQVLVMLPSS